MTNGVLTRRSSRLGSNWPAAGAPGQSSARALTTERGRQGSRGASGTDKSSSTSAGPKGKPA
eukprot:13604087-Alexandrium_andersonii.AAC.1